MPSKLPLPTLSGKRGGGDYSPFAETLPLPPDPPTHPPPAQGGGTAAAAAAADHRRHTLSVGGGGGRSSSSASMKEGERRGRRVVVGRMTTGQVTYVACAGTCLVFFMIDALQHRRALRWLEVVLVRF